MKGKWHRDIKVTDWGMLVTTIVLTYGTLNLYHEAVNQSGISSKSVDAAIAADSLTQIALKRDSIRSLKADSTDSVRFQKQYKLASNSLQAQVDAFQKENRPYILVKELITSTLDRMHMQQVTIRFQNFGKVPAYVFSEISQGKVSNTVDVLTDFNYSPRLLIEVNRILTPGETMDIPLGVPHSQEEVQPVYNGTKSTYIYGELYFRDIVKNKIEASSFCYRILASGYYVPNRVHNDIIDLSDSAVKALLKERPLAQRPIIPTP